MNEPSSTEQLARSAGVVGLFTLASRILGLLRDAVVAASYPKRATDAFFVAFTIPNVLRRLLAEGSLTVAFIPVYTEVRGRSPGEAQRMLQNMLGVTTVVLLLVTLLGTIFAPALVKLFAYGFVGDAERFGLAVFLLRLMFGFLVCVGLSALAMGVLNTVGHFAAPALSPVLLNSVIILAVLGLSHQARALGFPAIAALGLGVLAGGVGQLLLQLPVLYRRGCLVAPRFDFRDPGVLRVAALMGPAVFGLAIYELNVIIGRQFASLLSDGAISALYYAQRLLEFPIGVFAVSVATVTLPELSRNAARGEMAAFKATYQFALRAVFFVMLPATAGLLALRQPLIAVLLQRGAFTSELAQETGLALVGFCLALAGAGGVRQTVPVFYALKDTRTPVKVAAVCLTLYAIAAYALYRPWGTLGLALAVAVSSNTNFLLLLLMLRRKVGQLGLRAILRSVAKATVAAVICGVCASLVAELGHWESGGADLRSVTLLLAAIVAGGAAYLLAAALLRCPELGELWRALRRRRAR